MNRFLLFSFFILFISGSAYPQLISAGGYQYSGFDGRGEDIKINNAGDCLVTGYVKDSSNRLTIASLKISYTNNLIWIRFSQDTLPATKLNTSIPKTLFSTFDGNNITSIGLIPVNSDSSKIICLTYDSNGNLITTLKYYFPSRFRLIKCEGDNTGSIYFAGDHYTTAGTNDTSHVIIGKINLLTGAFWKITLDSAVANARDYVGKLHVASFDQILCSVVRYNPGTNVSHSEIIRLNKSGLSLSTINPSIKILTSFEEDQPDKVFFLGQEVALNFYGLFTIDSTGLVTVADTGQQYNGDQFAVEKNKVWVPTHSSIREMSVNCFDFMQHQKLWKDSAVQAGHWFYPRKTIVDASGHLYLIGETEMLFPASGFNYGWFTYVADSNGNSKYQEMIEWRFSNKIYDKPFDLVINSTGDFWVCGQKDKKLTVVRYRDSSNTVDVDQLPDQKNLITIYPNPTNSSIKINLNFQKPGKSRWELYTITGSKISECSFSEKDEYDLDLRPYTAGMYFIHLMSESGRIVRKIIKE